MSIALAPLVYLIKTLLAYPTDILSEVLQAVINSLLGHLLALKLLVQVVSGLTSPTFVKLLEFCAVGDVILRTDAVVGVLEIINVHFSLFIIGPDRDVVQVGVLVKSIPLFALYTLNCPCVHTVLKGNFLASICQ